MSSKTASSLVKKYVPGLLAADLAFASAGCGHTRDNIALIPDAWELSL